LNMRDYIEVNLLPIEYRIVKKDYSFLVDSRLLLGIILVIVSALGFMTGHQFIEANLSTKRAALQQVQDEIAKNGYVAVKIRELETIRDEKNAKNNSLKSITVNKRKWVRILEGLSKSMPLNTWIESVQQNPQNEQDMDIKGRTYVFPEVAEYMLELEKGEYFQKVSLASIEFQKEQDRSYFVFTLNVHTNPTAGMESFSPDVKRGKVL